MSGKKRKKREKKEQFSSEICDECIPAKCCMYFSIEIDEPENDGDYDDLLWIIAHRDTEIYVNEDRWYLLVRSPCRFYDPIKRCLIYTRRPRICRSHTTDECEFDDDYGFDLHFHTYEELERYIRTNKE